MAIEHRQLNRRHWRIVPFAVGRHRRKLPRYMERCPHETSEWCKSKGPKMRYEHEGKGYIHGGTTRRLDCSINAWNGTLWQPLGCV